MLILAVLIGLLGIGPAVNDIVGGGPVGITATTNDGSDALSGNGPPG